MPVASHKHRGLIAAAYYFEALLCQSYLVAVTSDASLFGEHSDGILKNFSSLRIGLLDDVGTGGSLAWAMVKAEQP